MIRVLLIEDDPMVQEVNKQFIDKVQGFEVIDKAGNGEDGLEKIRQLHPDLVILDVFMPHQDGVQVLQQLRKEKVDVDVIVVTAANDNETIREMLQNGAVDYIIKPFKFERMKQALENYKEYRDHLSNDRSMTQQELDRLLLKQKDEVKQMEKKIEVPKGLNESTLQQIHSYLDKQVEAQSAEDVAEGIGIARVTARRYLEFLKETGEIMLDVQYGGVGRPINRYIKV